MSSARASVYYTLRNKYAQINNSFAQHSCTTLNAGERRANKLKKEKKKRSRNWQQQARIGNGSVCAHVYNSYVTTESNPKRHAQMRYAHREKTASIYVCIYTCMFSLPGHSESHSQLTACDKPAAMKAEQGIITRRATRLPTHTHTRPEFSSKHVVTRYLFRLTHYHKNNSRKHRRLNISQRVCAHKRRPGQRQLSNIFLLLLLLQ